MSGRGKALGLAGAAGFLCAESYLPTVCAGIHTIAHHDQPMGVEFSTGPAPQRSAMRCSAALTAALWRVQRSNAGRRPRHRISGSGLPDRKLQQSPTFPAFAQPQGSRRRLSPQTRRPGPLRSAHGPPAEPRQPGRSARGRAPKASLPATRTKIEGCTVRPAGCPVQASASGGAAAPCRRVSGRFRGFFSPPARRSRRGFVKDLISQPTRTVLQVRADQLNI